MKLSEEWQKGVEQKVKLLFSKVLGANEKMCLLYLYKNQKNFLANPVLGNRKICDSLYCDICFIVLVCQYQYWYAKVCQYI